MRRSSLPLPLPLLAALLPLSLALTACGGSADGAAASSKDRAGSGAAGGAEVTLSIGDQKGGYESLLRAAGELDNLDYTVKWSTFTSGPPLLEAVNAKAVDIGGVGNTPPVFAAAAKSKITVVGATHGSSAGEAILVPKDSPLKSPAELRGKKIAVAQGSSAHFQLIASLQQAGLAPADVQITLLQPADALAAFNSGKVDAWAVWDPYTSQVLRAGARVLTSGEGLVNGLGFQVASPAALQDAAKSKAIADYLKRLQRAQDWVFEHPEEWAKVWSKETGLPYEVALDSVKRSNGTRVAVAVDDAAVASEQKIADTFADLKLIPGKVVFKDFVDTRFNRDLPPSTTAARAYGKDS
ncbi:ABC transporter substrate-binding protein [Streptomyces sp. NBC_00249]|uniref:ABC transporter substrate-binding protein n=1 Tax=Streptomyces sp. NBC_00249 TaxID=2975690 RepID=UPI00224E0A5D|nr:ABC transporter substrate-binding protein [Streptomyces sp. NBC_00249]MCX5197309.1 ABC transporter substrate-binding protein [Streptomyces sp. NBC_00249]